MSGNLRMEDGMLTGKRVKEKVITNIETEETRGRQRD